MKMNDKETISRKSDTGFENGNQMKPDTKSEMHSESSLQAESKTGKNIWLDKLQTIKMPREKKEQIAILFLLGVFFMLIATPLSTFSEKEETEDTGVESKNMAKTEEVEGNDAYITQMENKLEQTIGGMEGAGKVLVMITLKDSGEKILDKNQPYENSSEKSREDGKETEQSSIKSDPETVLIEEEGNTLPIVVQELYPDIEGVVVVCEGGDNSELALRIKEAVQALFSIDAHKIVVCKLQS